MEKTKSPYLRLLMAMLIGMFIIEMMIELSTGTTLWGGRNGIFISHTYSNAKIVNTPLQATGKIIATTNIHDGPSFNAGKVGKLAIGKRLRIIGKTTVDKDTWYQIQRFGGKIGYVWGEHITIKQ